MFSVRNCDEDVTIQWGSGLTTLDTDSSDLPIL